MHSAHSQHITALFHKMLDAIANDTTGLFELPLITKNHHRQIEFTLPQLFECFSQLNNELAKPGYTEFRKALFNSPINEEMKKRGGEIVIMDNKGKVDESVYCLRIGIINIQITS